MPGELVDLDEGALVEKPLDPFAGRELATGVLLVHSTRRAGMDGFVEALVEVGQLARGGVDVDVVSGRLGRCVAHDGRA